MSRAGLAALVALALVQPVSAQDFDAAARAFVASFEGMTVSDCKRDLAKRRLRYIAAKAADLMPLKLLLDAQRLTCDSLQAAPAPGGSQQPAPPVGAAADRPIVMNVKNGRAAEIEDLPGAALERALLAGQTIARLSPAEVEVFVTAIDSEAKHSIFDRFREGLPPKG